MSTLEPPAANTHPHVFQPTGTGCQGFAKQTQVQCRRSQSPGSRYCNLHSAQEGECLAFARGGWKCSNSIVPGGRGFFCDRHEDWATLKEIPCAGSKVGDDKESCYRRVKKPDYPYCMVQHDPSVIYCDPKKFRQANLRSRMFKPLMERDGVYDLYNIGQEITDSAAYQVEHKGEAQICAYMWQHDIFRNPEERKDFVDFCHDELVNAMPNLCITSTDTNKKKGRATMNMLEEITIFSLTNYDGRLDMRALDDICAAAANVPIVTTFNHRLHDEGLSRESTLAIRREMGRSLQRWKYAFLDHGDTSIFKKVGRLTQKLYTIMDLYVPYSIYFDVDIETGAGAARLGGN